MRKPLNLFVWSLVLVLAATPALAGGNANLFIGKRTVDIGESALDDLEDQTSYGVGVNFQTGDLPFSWVVGVSTSSEDMETGFVDPDPNIGRVSLSLDATITELSFGVAWIWDKGNMHPYAGGGLTRVETEVEVDFRIAGRSFDETEDDNAIGFYGEGGIYWTLAEWFNIGGGVRIVEGASMDIDGLDIDANYVEGAVLVGWHWD